MVLTILNRLAHSQTAFQTVMFYVGSFVINLGNYGFHFLLLRMLTPSEYGEFSSYLSLLYLLTIPSTAMSMLVTKQVADNDHDNLHRLNNLFYYLIKKTLIISLILGLILVSISNLIELHLKISKISIYILALSILITMISAVIGSFLLGQRKLHKYVALGLFGVILKIGFSALFIIIGFKVMGAVVSIFIASIVGTMLALINIRKVIFPKLEITNKFEFNKIGYASLIYSSASLSLISTDILMVRYFFDERSSGLYAAILTLSKTIHFGLMPLALLMIPLITKRYLENKPTKQILIGLVGMAILLGSLGVFLFVLFPHQLMKIMSGSEYLDGVSLLLPGLISILVFTINLILVNYFIAISKHKIIYGLLFAMILQPILISLFHTSLSSVYAINIILQLGIMIWICWFGISNQGNSSTTTIPIIHKT